MIPPLESLGWLWAVCAVMLQTGGFLVIIAGIRRATVHPNPFSWLIWSLVASLAAAGSWRAGATWPLGGALANALGCLAVLVSTLGRGRFVADRIDLGCLAVAAAGIVAWSSTSDPVIGLALFLAADAAGAVPTLRTAALDGRSESVAGWALLALAGLAAVCSVEPVQWIWTWAGFGQWGGAVYVAAVNAVVTATILLARGLRPSVRRPATAALLG